MGIQSFQIKYTLGADIVYDHYAIPVIRTTLTRNIGNRFHDMQDEIAAAFTDHMPATEGEVPPPACLNFPGCLTIRIFYKTGPKYLSSLPSSKSLFAQATAFSLVYQSVSCLGVLQVTKLKSAFPRSRS